MTLVAGVLALQGDIEEHVHALERALKELNISFRIMLVKKVEQLSNIDLITIPGGESTTIGFLSRKTGLIDRLKERIEDGLPVLGTCAGMVMMAREVRDAVVGETSQPLLAVMDISVIRNIFGRQRESFEIDLKIPAIGDRPFRAVFIRAPAAIRCWNDAQPLATLRHEKYGELVVMVRQRNMLACAFHPELVLDTRVHKYFITEVAGFPQR
ncbi:MAG: pyridoxal 5'-phosphate synthase glutaminase subunit PdxT [Crenarchaeota archaeon]|nr:pyridoxal 5'-phosphate synthase glutaminase subunit PdxT [Thermoproteota archaeon]